MTPVCGRGTMGSSVHCGLPKAVKNHTRAVSTLSSSMVWILEEICRHPSPIYNYLLISCFVSAVMARANEMNTAAVRKGSPRVRRAVKGMTPILPKLISHWLNGAHNLRVYLPDNKRKDI